MIKDIILMNGYGFYVWMAFGFTFASFAFLYAVVKIHYVKELNKFNNKYLSLSSEQKNYVAKKETYKEILANTSASKI